MTMTTEAFVQRGSELIQRTALALQPAMVRGAKTWTLMLTPELVTKTSAPRFMAPRAVIPFDINHGVRSLHSHRVTSHGEETTIHVYEAGVKFPEHGEHHKVVEVAVFKTGWGKMDLVKDLSESNAAFEKRSTRYREAFGHHRYWFAIPTSFGQGEITIEPRQITFTHRAYARSFAELNHLEGGVWKSEKQRKNEMAGIAVAVVGSIAPLFFMEGLIERFGWVSILIAMAGAAIATITGILIASRGKEPL